MNRQQKNMFRKVPQGLMGSEEEGQERQRCSQLWAPLEVITILHMPESPEWEKTWTILSGGCLCLSSDNPGLLPMRVFSGEKNLLL